MLCDLTALERSALNYYFRSPYTLSPFVCCIPSYCYPRLLLSCDSNLSMDQSHVEQRSSVFCTNETDSRNRLKVRWRRLFLGQRSVTRDAWEKTRESHVADKARLSALGEISLRRLSRVLKRRLCNEFVVGELQFAALLTCVRRIDVSTALEPSSTAELIHCYSSRSIVPLSRGSASYHGVL